MQVIDGQHRLAAAKELDLPVYFLVSEEADLKTTQAVNTSSRKWSAKDYVDSYAAAGDNEYIYLQQFIETFSLPVSTALFLLSGVRRTGLAGGGKLLSNMKEGKYRVMSPERGAEIARWMATLRPYCTFNPNANRDFVAALAEMYTHERFSFDRLVSKLEAHQLKIDRRPSVKYFILLIEEIYNHNAKSDAAKVQLYEYK
jgi:hypothetical protein